VEAPSKDSFLTRLTSQAHFFLLFEYFRSKHSRGLTTHNNTEKLHEFISILCAAQNNKPLPTLTTFSSLKEGEYDALRAPLVALRQRTPAEFQTKANSFIEFITTDDELENDVFTKIFILLVNSDISAGQPFTAEIAEDRIALSNNYPVYAQHSNEVESNAILASALLTPLKKDCDISYLKLWARLVVDKLSFFEGNIFSTRAAARAHLVSLLTNNTVEANTLVVGMRNALVKYRGDNTVWAHLDTKLEKIATTEHANTFHPVGFSSPVGREMQPMTPSNTPPLIIT
jgi:hypothetical protein